MNKDELIKLKEELIKNERYALLDQDMEISLTSKTKLEIEQEIITDKAIKTFENILELYLKMCVSDNLDFDTFKVNIYPEYYVSIDKIKNEKGFIDENKISKDAILNNIVNIRYAIYSYNGNKKVIPSFNYETKNSKLKGYNSFIEYCYNKVYTVDYDKFIRGVTSLGYEISVNASKFDNLIGDNNFLNGEVEFTSIDFMEKAKKK